MTTETKKRFDDINNPVVNHKQLLDTARKHLKQIGELEANVGELEKNQLDHAKSCGRILRKLKKRVKLRGKEWLPWIKQQLNISPQTTALYMRISQKWSELEPHREKNPHLSIKAADLLLRKKGGRKKLVEEPAVIEARHTVRKVIASLTPNAAVYFADNSQTIIKRIEQEAAEKVPAQTSRRRLAMDQAKAVA